MSECKHENREYDLYCDSEINKETLMLCVPSWCKDCACEDDDVSDYKEIPIYYVRSHHESDPIMNGHWETLRFEGFYDLMLEEDDFNPDDLEADIELRFEAGHHDLGPMPVKLTITYKRCSKEKHDEIMDKLNTDPV